MKAYKAYDINDDEGICTIVFALNARMAKQIAHSTDALQDADYIDIRVNRLPAADKLCKERSEIDWYDKETRIALVKDFSLACIETSLECDNCPAKKWCRHFEGIEDEEQ